MVTECRVPGNWDSYELSFWKVKKKKNFLSRSLADTPRIYSRSRIATAVCCMLFLVDAGIGRRFSRLYPRLLWQLAGCWPWALTREIESAIRCGGCTWTSQELDRQTGAGNAECVQKQCWATRHGKTCTGIITLLMRNDFLCLSRNFLCFLVFYNCSVLCNVISYVFWEGEGWAVLIVYFLVGMASILSLCGCFTRVFLSGYAGGGGVFLFRQMMNVHFWFHALSEIPDIIVWIKNGQNLEVREGGGINEINRSYLFQSLYQPIRIASITISTNRLEGMEMAHRVWGGGFWPALKIYLAAILVFLICTFEAKYIYIYIEAFYFLIFNLIGYRPILKFFFIFTPCFRIGFSRMKHEYMIAVCLYACCR